MFKSKIISRGGVEVVKASLDLTGKILILIKEDLESWMSATERSATPLSTEKSSSYCTTHLNFLREGGTEHECLSLSCFGHVTFLDDLSNLRLETHVQHPVSFIKATKPEKGEVNISIITV